MLNDAKIDEIARYWVIRHLRNHGGGFDYAAHGRLIRGLIFVICQNDEQRTLARERSYYFARKYALEDAEQSITFDGLCADSLWGLGGTRRVVGHCVKRAKALIRNL
jgi:hypothetical protein